ncbi:MAG: O-antigen polymerase [Deltaproteobacteria bacterium]
MVRILLVSLINICFLTTVFVRFFTADSVGSAYFIIALMSLSMVAAISINYLTFGRVLNLLNFFILIFAGYYLLTALLIMNDMALLTLFPQWTFTELNNALCLAFFAFSAAINGYALSTGEFLLRFLPGFDNQSINQKRLRAVIVSLIGASIILLLMFFRSLGGVGNYVYRMAAMRVMDEFLGKGIFHIPMTILANTAMFLVFGLQRKKVFMFVVVFLTAFLINFFSASRLNLAIFFLGLIFIRQIIRPVRLRAKHIVIAVLAFFLIGPVPLALRGGYGEVSFGSIKEAIGYTASYVMTFDPSFILGIIAHGNATETLMAITSKIQETGGFMYGRFFFGSIVLGFIPRAIWPARPPIGAHLVNEYFWRGAVADTGAPATTMVGEIYWDFGLMGVGIVFFAFGCLLKAVERYRTRSAGNLWAAIFYAEFLWFWAIYSNETFIGAFSSWLLYLSPLFLVFRITTMNPARETALGRAGLLARDGG